MEAILRTDFAMRKFSSISYLLAGLAILPAGCSWLNKPYANDPLIKRGKAIRGDPNVCDHTIPWQDPHPPLPPTEVIPAPTPK